MINSELAHTASVGSQDAVPQPFATTLPLHAPTEDSEEFGTVTASLSADLIRIGPAPEQGAVFEFGIESQPLLALVTFEIANPRIDSPPEVIANGQNVGAASAIMPGLADPGYPREMHRHRQPDAIPVDGLASSPRRFAGKRPTLRNEQHRDCQRTRCRSCRDSYHSGSTEVSLGEV